ncbi:MAG: hypothetical protein LBT00_07670 [Spirochaetaceae bacterium]|nr:hypothetical protein [Spirochaetaceae bacterium]
MTRGLSATTRENRHCEPKGRSNPDKEGPHTGLLRFARNDASLNARFLNRL